MKKKSIIKLIIVLLILIVAFISIFMIYKNLFASSNNTRYDDIEKHKLTNDEKNATKDILKEIENADEVDIYVNSKIIKIIISLKEDTDFEQVKNISNQVVSKISEKNLKFYDIQIFVESNNEESEIYPKIGYKHKSKEDFTW